jgi:uncharacterized paraquat-inducible protein A
MMVLHLLTPTWAFTTAATLLTIPATMLPPISRVYRHGLCIKTTALLVGLLMLLLCCSQCLCLGLC